MQDSTTAYETIGSQGLKEIAAEYRVNDDIGFVESKTSLEEKILDLGCGYGRVLLPLTVAGYTNLTGIDISPNLIADATKEAELKKLHIRFDVGDMRNLPYLDGSFQKVFCLWNSFNEILSEDDQLKVISEVYRVLSTKGEVFFVVLNGEDKTIETEVQKQNTNGTPPIITKNFKGGIIRHFVHTRSSLSDLIGKSQFKNFSVKFISMHQRTRILLHLVK